MKCGLGALGPPLVKIYRSGNESIFMNVLTVLDFCLNLVSPTFQQKSEIDAAIAIIHHQRERSTTRLRVLRKKQKNNSCLLVSTTVLTLTKKQAGNIMSPPEYTEPGAAAETTSSRLQQNMLSEEEAAKAVESFTEFLQFETVSMLAAESGAYTACAAWLVQQLNDAAIFSEVFLLPEAPDHSPVVCAVMKGRDETLPILLLNSHYDVVPAETKDWTVPPFEGLEKDGNIYGRGTQDMKCVCVQYIQALIKICRVDPDWVPERSIYLSFVPDEEVGGGGMAAFLESATYKELPGIALALDEGLSSVTDTFAVFYGERLPWWVNVTAQGPTGHGSRFIDHTAVEQLIDLANKALAFREGQRAQLGLSRHENCAHAVAAANSSKKSDAEGKPNTLGDVTSLNITTLSAVSD
jgi:N-acyl-L-amino-acid amidohydrolase